MGNYQYVMSFIHNEKSILNALPRTFRSETHKFLHADNGIKVL